MLDLQSYCYIVVARITETNKTQTQTYKYTCLHKVSVVFKSAVCKLFLIKQYVVLHSSRKKIVLNFVTLEEAHGSVN